MPSKYAFFPKNTAIAVIALAALSLTATGASAAAIDGESGLRQNIGFLSLVKLECEFSSAGNSGGTMTLHNPTGKQMNRGIPVIYRLSSTGEQFTTHLKNPAGPMQSTTFEHRHAQSGGCEAWTYLR